MKLNIGEKEFSIKFAYEPTLKERLVSRIVKISNRKTGDDDEVGGMEKIEDMLLFLPEILLVGLQVHHKDYAYDYDTKKGKDEQLAKAFKLIGEYSESKDADLMKLFSDLQEEMKNDSFLASLFRQAEAAEKAEEVVQPKLEVVQTQEQSEN